ncbi:MAG: hypothetical protein AAF960_09520 [Bacteroidota bacterium]
MNYLRFSSILFMFSLLIITSCNQKLNETVTTAKTTATSSLDFNKYTITGATVLAFGVDNILLIGDSKAAKVHAVKTVATKLENPVPFNMEGFDVMLSKKLGIPARDVIVQDMKIHPISQEAYVAVRMGHQPTAKSIIAIAHPATRDIRFLEINESNSTSTSVQNPASSELLFWKETPASALTITDVDYHDGYVYVAGLTNSEFASTLRKIKYPFDNTQEAVNSIEVYHAVHTQNETRAPIRTMLFDELNGESTLIASYTCTPLVTIPTAAITGGAAIKGKTIAELGYGNTPIDMLVVTTKGFDGTMSKSLLVTNKNRGGTMIPFPSVEAGAKGNGMAGQQAMFATGLEGINEIPTANVMQIDIQNPQMLGVVRRNIETGDIDLVSELTGTFLRLSDFISEYDFPDYRYPDNKMQQGTKQYHDMVKQMEGYPELTSEKMGRN